MNVKEAVRTAKEYVSELYEDESVKHLGVEEVLFDEGINAWRITVGFYRPWNKNHGLTALIGETTAGEPALWKRRSFKVVQVDGNTGDIHSMIDRSLPSLS
ncbi:MAG: hypothetical protein OXG56_05640 [Gammaproteobacteria bacterium]|nr:hypothetical protein [Gammaproteobacteria bacterium]